MRKNKIYIYGKHAVTEALQSAPHVVDRIFLAKNIKDDTVLQSVIKKTGVTTSSLGSDKETKAVENQETHQGVVGRISLDKLIIPYADFIGGLKVSPNTALLVLDEIEDPHNVGAIIRSAAAFGVSGVLIPSHNQAPITGTVVKVSAGMAFHVPLILIGNINTTLRDLKKKGFWIYGLEGDTEKSIAKESYDRPSVFVLGNESQGIRLKTREICDVLVSIEMNPQTESLNVAATAAVALFAWSSQHPSVLRDKMIKKNLG